MIHEIQLEAPSQPAINIIRIGMFGLYMKSELSPKWKTTDLLMSLHSILLQFVDYIFLFNAIILSY